jgi:CRISPR/Cas system-associated endonuclease Cas1
MRKLLNTVYVATEDAFLRRDGLKVVEVECVEKLRVPLHLLSGVAVFGQVSLSPALMGSLAEAGVVTAFFGMNVRFLARGRAGFGQCSAAARAISRAGRRSRLHPHRLRLRRRQDAEPGSGAAACTT